MTTIRLLHVSLLAGVLAATGCKKAAPEPMPLAAVQEPARPAPRTEAEEVRQLVENFQRVHFDYDSSTLDGQTKRLLDDNAAILQRRVDVKIEVQGHCDERGTTDYNLALGNRRAVTVRDYLLANGVSSARISVVSYGEERPLASGDTETAWAENRRAEFRVTVGGDGLVDGTTR